MTPSRSVIMPLTIAVLVMSLRLAVGASAGPATTQASTPPDLQDVQEQALRELAEFANERGTRFVAVGFDDSQNPIDPTPQFLARFDDLEGTVKPASDAKHLRDPKTRKRTRVHYVLVRGRHADDEVRIRVGFTSGKLSGGGREAIYRFVDGRWTLNRVLYDFVN